MQPTVKVVRKNHIKLPTKLTGPSRVKVGFPAGKVDSLNISKAIWNHYGTSRGIPPRPFLLNAMRRHRAKYLQAMKSAGAQILRGTMDSRTALNRLGIMAQGDVQQEINMTMTPPNAAATIRAKGSSHPLIDTGEMKGKVTWKVDD